MASERTFRPGDVVLIVEGDRRGAITTITSELRPVLRFKPEGILVPGTLCHDLAIPPIWGGKVAVAPPHWLVPISNPDDAETLLSELRVGQVEETE